MAPVSQISSLPLAPPTMLEPLAELPLAGPPSPSVANTPHHEPAAPSALPYYTPSPFAHPSSHTDTNLTQAPHLDIIWTAHKFQRLKRSCKSLVHGLIAICRGKHRQRKSTKHEGTPSNTTVAPPATHNAFYQDYLPGGAIHEDTWCSLVHIVYAVSAQGSEIMRHAKARFDSQSPWDLMSSDFAVNVLGLPVTRTVPTIIGQTITGGPVYSTGWVKVRWAPAEAMPQTTPSGRPLSFPPKFFDAYFYVVDSGLFEVIIGHKSLLRNGIYGSNPPVIAPGFRSIISTGGSPTATAVAEDQAHAAAVEAERLRVRQAQQQSQSSAKP